MIHLFSCYGRRTKEFGLIDQVWVGRGLGKSLDKHGSLGHFCTDVAHLLCGYILRFILLFFILI